MDRRTLEKRYDQVVDEVQFLRLRVRDLEQELEVTGPALYRADQRIDRLEQQRDKLAAENQVLKQKLADVTAKLKSQPPGVKKPPAFIKPNTPQGRTKKPGRKVGHEAALRPMPATIDIHETVVAPVDTMGQACCPECRAACKAANPAGVSPAAGD
jgi:hypothetical protein